LNLKVDAYSFAQNIYRKEKRRDRGVLNDLAVRGGFKKKKSQPEKNQEPAFHPLFVNPKKVEFENVFVSRFTSYPIDGKLSK
jgi:hypothetical protein